MSRILVVLALLCGLHTSATAQEQVLQVIGFPGGPNWPLWVAQEKGFFSQQGLRVEFTPTPSSTFLVRGLMDDKFNIGLAAIDNVIAYQEGQGEAKVDTTPDMFAFLGNLRGSLRLIAIPEIHSILGLRGKAIAVDAKTT